MKEATVNEERFWSKVDTTGECWLWTSRIERSGYGRFKSSGKYHYAHRVAYGLAVGPIPDGLTIDHLCRVRNCVNPAHLEPVTQRENTLRGEGVAARNARKTHCPQGHEYTLENTCVSRGLRHCRTCNRDRTRERRALSKVG